MGGRWGLTYFPLYSNNSYFIFYYPYIISIYRELTFWDSFHAWQWSKPCFEIVLHGSFPKLGYHFGGPYNKDYNILGSILGSPYFGKLPHCSHSRSDHSLSCWNVSDCSELPDGSHGSVAVLKVFGLV